MVAVATPMVELSKALGFKYVFKASFDKANRTSGGSFRGHGVKKTLGWFGDLKTKFPGLPILTDIHETTQVAPVAEVVDVLQIPAFLSRQTDLINAAVTSGRSVNIKKGQFLAPEVAPQIVAKAKSAAQEAGLSDLDIALTERGSCFGYNNLVVDMRSFGIMAKSGVPIIFDITHSTQLPGAGEKGAESSARRDFAPPLARAAAATGYVHGFFLEVHENPRAAKSDKDAQLAIPQATSLLKQILPIWQSCQQASAIDGEFLPG
jgi:2-dehydro-3-deoxyphosphooctonate aldolase (KDO 8-P synthase)